MSEHARPIGLLGGTFDPVHIGHLRAALEAHQVLRLEQVRLLPLNLPGHRSPPIASAEARLAMVQAVATWPLVADNCELLRGGVTYTVDTLRELRERWPDRSLCLLLGRDAFHSLPAWHCPEQILKLAHVVVAARPGVELATAGLDELIANAQSEDVEDLHRKPAGHVYFLDIPLLPIASSELRARLAAGQDIRHLVPDAVYDIITQRGLY